MSFGLNFSLKTWADRLIRLSLDELPFEVSFHDVPLGHLPDAFNGFTIVQISDLHIDRWNTPIVEAAIDTVNRLRPDVLVCTGDTIANGRHYLGDVRNILGQMQARHGKLACMGNHDYSDGSRSQGVREALRGADFEVLVNESTELTLQNRQIQFAGADDLILGRQCLKSTARRLSDDKPRILLSHNPENFEAMARFQPDLILSGHTHGGQIRIPEGIRRQIMNSPYIAGLYQQMDSRLYVNRGLGAAVFVHHWQGRRITVPTPRIFVRPEISVFRLTRRIEGPRPGDNIRQLTPWTERAGEKAG